MSFKLLEELGSCGPLQIGVSLGEGIEAVSMVWIYLQSWEFVPPLIY